VEPGGQPLARTTEALAAARAAGGQHAGGGLSVVVVGEMALGGFRCLGVYMRFFCRSEGDWVC